MEGSSLRAVARAGMARECQVRICERLGVKFPGAYSANPAVISALASGLLLPQSMAPNWPGPAVMVGSRNRLGCVRIGATCSRGRRLSCRLAASNWLARTCFQTSSLVIQRVTDRCVGDQPRSAAALPPTRLFEPSENTAMFRPQAAIVPWRTRIVQRRDQVGPGLRWRFHGMSPPRSRHT